jgi:hypothetical protein
MAVADETAFYRIHYADPERDSIVGGTETTTTQSLAHCISTTKFHSAKTTATSGRGSARRFQRKSSGRHSKDYSRIKYRHSPPIDDR